MPPDRLCAWPQAAKPSPTCNGVIIGLSPVSSIRYPADDASIGTPNSTAKAAGVDCRSASSNSGSTHRPGTGSSCSRQSSRSADRHAAAWAWPIGAIATGPSWSAPHIFTARSMRQTSSAQSRRAHAPGRRDRLRRDSTSAPTVDGAEQYFDGVTADQQGDVEPAGGRRGSSAMVEVEARKIVPAAELAVVDEDTIAHVVAAGPSRLAPAYSINRSTRIERLLAAPPALRRAGSTGSAGRASAVLAGRGAARL